MENQECKLKNAKQTKRKCCKIKEKTKMQSKPTKSEDPIKNNQKQTLRRSKTIKDTKTSN